jgi:integrase
VYKQEVGDRIHDMVQAQGQDVCSSQMSLKPRSLCSALALTRPQLIKAVAEVKKLDYGKRESATMYVQDLAEFARVVLATTEMSFDIGWLRVQLILFFQLAAITGNRPEALVNLRYRHLKLTLIRDPTGQSGPYPRLFIELTAEYTKTFLGIKDKYVSLESLELMCPPLLTRVEGTSFQFRKSSLTRRLCSALTSSCWACSLRLKPSNRQTLRPQRSFIV